MTRWPDSLVTCHHELPHRLALCCSGDVLIAARAGEDTGATGYLVMMVATTFIPGRKTAFSGGIGSSAIFTGIRCTTFT